MDGVTEPWFFIGSRKSIAAFHTEDSNLLSLNIMVEGLPKQWFFIRPGHAKKYENFLRSRYPGKPCLNVASHKDTFPDIRVLKKEGIEFYTFTQYPGDVVITGPEVYHGIINHGTNINLAVNFANKLWSSKYHFSRLLCTCGFGNSSEASAVIDSLLNALKTGKKNQFYDFADRHFDAYSILQGEKGMIIDENYELSSEESAILDSDDPMAVMPVKRKKTGKQNSETIGKFKQYKCKITGKTRYQCKDCEQSFSQKKSFNIHFVNQHRKRSVKHKNGIWKCCLCKKKFDKEKKFRQHWDKNHTSQDQLAFRKEEFQCHSCNKKFATKSYRDRHRQKVHEGDGHECIKCMKTFTTIQQLKAH